MARLILSLDGQTLAEYNMTKERYTVGRLPDNDIRIDNAAVSGHHEWRALGERGDQPGGDEKVSVDDVGARCAACVARQLEVSELPSRSTVEHGAVDLVAPLHERALHLRDENAEVGVGRPRVHLRDEEDAHRRRR